MTRKMKDSGIEWIGEIPEDWDVSKIGSHYIERTDKVSDLEFEPLSVTKNGIVPQLETAAKSSNHNNRKLVLKNDFVINSRSDRKMSAGISSMDGSVSVINTVLYSKTIDRDYTKYLLKNYAFAEEFYRWGTGIVDDLWSTKWLKMKNISIPVPPKEKQKQIGAVIDRLTQNTNNIITETQQSIEELKKYKQSLITEAVTKGLDPNVEMKDSGIEWVGEIPENWKLIQLKYIAKINGRIGYRGYTTNDIVDEGEGAITLSPSNISDLSLNFKNKTYLSWDKYYESPEIMVSNNDIIFCKTGSGYGKCGIVESLQEKMTINPQLVIIRPRNIDSKYLNYVLNSLLISNQVETIVGGSSMPTISQENLLKMKVCLPKKQQTKQIVSYLDEQTALIDKLIADKTKVIEELEDYKKSLIYEYVTGKKEV